MSPEIALMVRAVLLFCLVLGLERLGKRRAAKKLQAEPRYTTLTTRKAKGVS